MLINSEKQPTNLWKNVVDATLDNLRTSVPEWVPDSALMYIAHFDVGLSMRFLARELGLNPSTISRRIHKLERECSDPLVRSAVRRITNFVNEDRTAGRKKTEFKIPFESFASDNVTQHKVRITLEKLCQPGTTLAVCLKEGKASIAKATSKSTTIKTDSLDILLSEVLAINGWIKLVRDAREFHYCITPNARDYLRKEIGKTRKRTFDEFDSGHPGSKTVFKIDPKAYASKTPIQYGPHNISIRSDIPLAILSRLRDRSGEAFLAPDLVAAGQRLREDFELSKLSLAENKNYGVSIRKIGTSSSLPKDILHNDPSSSLRDAIEFVGPVLSDVLLRCCCYLQGLSSLEKEFGWSARSGKIVLRIALMQLAQHYERKGMRLV